MSLRTALAALAGLLLPVGLGLAVYFSAAGAIGASPSAAPVSLTVGHPAATTPRAEDRKDEKKAKRKRSAPGTTTTTVGTTDDHGGRCSEPEHVNDPECLSGGDDSGSNSGPGSDSSGPGSGGDD